MGVGIAGGRLASRPYQMGGGWNGGVTPIKGEEVRGLGDLSVSRTATPITLTSILSQDGRGGKMGLDSGFRRNDGYSKVSRMGEDLRGKGVVVGTGEHSHLNLPSSRGKG